MHESPFARLRQLASAGAECLSDADQLSAFIRAVHEADAYLHDDAALAQAVAQARRDALEEADNREVERILGLSDAEVIAEIEAEGRDPEALAESMRGQMNATFRLCEEIKHWKEEARSWRAVAERLETEKQAAVVGTNVRQAIARLLDQAAAFYGSPDYFGPDLNRATYSARHRAALKTADAILALLAANPPEDRQTETGWRPPVGWKLVPEEPTPEMRDAAIDADSWVPSEAHGKLLKAGYGRVYRAMVAAAPPPPAFGNLDGEGRSHA